MAHDLCKMTVNGCRSQFFSQRIVNVWNGLPHTVDFSSLTSFKRTINDVDYGDFLKIFLL